MENVIETVRRRRRNGGHAAEHSTEWKNLVADVEDLVKKVARVDDEEIAEIRARVEDTLAKAKGTASAGFAAMRERAEEMRERAEEISDATDEYVHENPWAVAGIAAAVGIVVGFLAARR